MKVNPDKWNTLGNVGMEGRVGFLRFRRNELQFWTNDSREVQYLRLSEIDFDELDGLAIDRWMNPHAITAITQRWMKEKE